MHISLLKTILRGLQLSPEKTDTLMDIATDTRTDIRVNLARMGAISEPINMRISAVISPKSLF